METSVSSCLHHGSACPLPDIKTSLVDTAGDIYIYIYVIYIYEQNLNNASAVMNHSGHWSCVSWFGSTIMFIKVRAKEGTVSQSWMILRLITFAVAKADWRRPWRVHRLHNGGPGLFCLHSRRQRQLHWTRQGYHCKVINITPYILTPILVHPKPSFLLISSQLWKCRSKFRRS